MASTFPMGTSLQLLGFVFLGFIVLESEVEFKQFLSVKAIYHIYPVADMSIASKVEF